MKFCPAFILGVLLLAAVPLQKTSADILWKVDCGAYEVATGQSVNFPSGVRAADSTKYGLRVMVNRGNVSSFVRIKYSINNGSPMDFMSERAVPPNFEPTIIDQRFGTASVGTYKYIVEYSESQTGLRYGNLDPTYRNCEVTVNFTAGNTMPPVGRPTPTNPPIGLPNTNTGITGVPDWDASTGNIDNPLTAKSVPELIARIIKILLSIIASIAVIVIIISGFRMVMYGSNPGEIAKAKSAIVWAILGLVVALLSFSIVAIIQGIIQR